MLAGGGYWRLEPGVGRVANGVPCWMDRVRCLGNAVMPQQFYPFFKAIYELEALFNGEPTAKTAAGAGTDAAAGI